VIRPAVGQDGAAIWAILEPVIRAGETYALDRDMPRDGALAYWLGGDRASFVAEGEGRVLGTYYLRANQAGGGAHVANCGYATHPDARGCGIARAMAEHSFAAARAQGFRAMQFNFVVSSNAPPCGSGTHSASRRSGGCPMRSIIRAWGWWMR